MTTAPLKTFICYAREDRPALEALMGHLAVFQRNGQVQFWYDREITGGKNWDDEIRFNLKTADIVLLLVSPDFFRSDYIHSVELDEALRADRAGEALVVPVILKKCLWQKDANIARLQALPTEGKPVFDKNHWPDPDDALYNVAEEFDRILEDPATSERRNRREARVQREEAEEQQRLQAEAARQKREAEAAEKKRKEEESARIKREAEASEKKRKEEEATRLKHEAETAEKKRKEEEAARLKREAEIAARRQRDELEKTDHHTFYLAQTRRDFEDYLKKGYTLHAAEANEKIGLFLKQEEDAARLKREAEAAEKKRKEAEAARLKADLPEMVFVKGGTFQMGEKGIAEPVHKVTLSDFEIGKYPVTQKQWTEIMGANPSHFKSCDDCPVESVSWDDVQEFLKKLNTKFPGKNYRLPTEAEWEFAARGGNLSNGYTYASSNDLSEVGWYSENADGNTHPVGKKKANELGLHDMSGNVWEWCADRYEEYETSAQTNPTGPKTDSFRVRRGGSWSGTAVHCRVSYRPYWRPGIRGRHLGFRIASSVQ